MFAAGLPDAWRRLFSPVARQRAHRMPLVRCFDRELNNMGIWYRMGTVPRAQDSVHAPTGLGAQTVVSVPQPAPTPALPKYAPGTCRLTRRRLDLNSRVFLLSRHISMTLPASFRGKNATRPDHEHQNSNLYAISG